MEARSRHKFEQEFMAERMQSFRNHELVFCHEFPSAGGFPGSSSQRGSQGAMLRIMQRTEHGLSSIYWSDIAISGGYVVLYGDIDTVAFCGGQGDWRSRLAWLASSSVDYVAEKAARGTDSSVAYMGEPGVAMDQILYHRRHKQIGRDGARAAYRLIVDGDVDEARRSLYEHEDDCELAGYLGECTSYAVMTALCAARRAHQLVSVATEEESARG